MMPVYRLPVWFPFYLVVVVGLMLLFASCGALGLVTSDDLRLLADNMDATKDTATEALKLASAVPGWPGILASGLGTVLAGGATLNKYRNLTRATDPTVSNTAKVPHA